MKAISRNLSTDLLKSISIFGVVLIHCLSFFESESYFNLYLSSLFRFCVPCFIVLWAFYFEISYIKIHSTEIKKFVIYRFINFFRIFFIWSFFYFFIQFEGQINSIKKIVTTFFLGYGWSGQYFFIIIFQLILLYPIIRFIYYNKKYRDFTIFLLVLVYFIYGYFAKYLPQVLLVIGNRFFIYWIPYVFLGIYLSKRNLIKIPLSFSFCICLIPCEVFFLKYLNIKYDVYITIIIFLSSSLLCLSILKNNHFNKNTLFTRLITYLGSNTLIIFIANPIVIFILKKELIKYTSINLTAPVKLLYLFLLTSVTVFICLLIKEAIQKLKLKKYLI
jgi:surface polysaccharide O-acyltransferase-like enzyme